MSRGLCGGESSAAEQHVEEEEQQHQQQQQHQQGKGPDDIEEAEVEIIDDNKP